MTTQSHIVANQANAKTAQPLGRYETGIWRQLVQIVLLLNSIGRGHGSCRAPCCGYLSPL